MYTVNVHAGILSVSIQSLPEEDITVGACYCRNLMRPVRLLRCSLLIVNSIGAYLPCQRSSSDV